MLSYNTTDKNGYKQYKSNKEKCKNCPLRDQCTKSKNCQKVITRHIWEEYKEKANENRYIQLLKDNYPLRKETLKRTFGDCKEQHGLRFIRVRGLLKNEQNATMIFACYKLKKWLIRGGRIIQIAPLFYYFFQKCTILLKHNKKSNIFFLNISLCQHPENLSIDRFYL